jgi:hypothetical protein
MCEIYPHSFIVNHIVYREKTEKACVNMQSSVKIIKQNDVMKWELAYVNLSLFILNYYKNDI